MLGIDPAGRVEHQRAGPVAARFQTALHAFDQPDVLIDRGRTVLDGKAKQNYLPRHQIPFLHFNRLDARPGKSRIGTASSIAFGHATGKLLAFAYVRPQYATAGTELEVVIMGPARKARVLSAPVHDPENLKPRTDA